MKPTPGAKRVQKHRDLLRKRGLKPVQIWVPDVKKKGFEAECKRQSILARNSDKKQNIDDFIESASDLKGWE